MVGRLDKTPLVILFSTVAILRSADGNLVFIRSRWAETLACDQLFKSALPLGFLNMGMEIFAAIRRRRSIREFTDQPVTMAQLREIVTAGIWAPSGLNNQPWRFVLIRAAEIKEELASQTTYGHIVRAAAALIGVFLDEKAMYDPVKDHQAAGACIQNMLLATEALGLGGVWLGQILKNKEQVRRIVGLAEGFDLMALLAIGYPAHRNQRSNRKELSHFILKEID